MRPLAGQVATGGVTARPISFLSDDIGLDLARIAADQGCETILLGWHRASLAHHVIQALVRRVLALAPCDAAVFVDRAGVGIATPPSGTGPVLMALAGGAHDAAVLRVGTHMAQQLGAGLTLVGFVGAQPTPDGGGAAALARLAEEAGRASGQPATPVFAAGDAAAAALAAAGEAAVAIVPAGEDWRIAEDFGRPAADLVALLPCPAIVVRVSDAARREGGKDTVLPRGRSAPA
jgi:hypothetical protein